MQYRLFRVDIEEDGIACPYGFLICLVDVRISFVAVDFFTMCINSDIELDEFCYGSC